VALEIIQELNFTTYPIFPLKDAHSIFLKKEVFYFQKCLEMCTLTFTHNNEYRGHGAAIFYLPNTNSHRQHKLFIQSSKFIFNKATQSVVYIDGSSSRIPGHVYLQDNVFVNNIRVPVYISHTNLHINGNVLFKGNTGKSGGGIYSNNSTIILNSNTNFISNSVTPNGGAIYQIYSRIIFRIISSVTFQQNNAILGGATYCNNANIRFNDNSSVTYKNNKA